MRGFAIGIAATLLFLSAHATPGVDEPWWPSRVSHRSEFTCGFPDPHVLRLELRETNGGADGKLDLIDMTIDGKAAGPAVLEGVQAMLNEFRLLKGYSAGCFQDYWILDVRGEAPGPPATASKVFFATFSANKFSQYQEYK